MRYILDKIKVSMYKNIAPKTEKAIFIYTGFDTLEGFMANCMNGGGITGTFEKIRKEPDETKQKALKIYLPAYTISATYKAGRKIPENILCHTGMFCIDIDQQDNPSINDWAKVRDELFKAWEEVVCCALSVRGNGIFVIINLEGATLENHADFFDALSSAFLRAGFVVDKICKDIGRMRYLTYDPELKYRAFPKAFKLPPPAPKIRLSLSQANRPRRKKSYKADVYTNAMKYAEKKWGPFRDGNKHIFIASVTSTLKKAGVSRQERESFVVNNLIDKSQIKTNCINKS